MNYLITGASGFVGGHLANELVKQGNNVSCLVRHSSNTKSLENLNVNIIRSDIEDIQNLTNAIKNIDCVFHLAGAIKSNTWNGYYNGNVVFTKNLLEACSKQTNPPYFVYLSSVAAAGPSKEGVYINENNEAKPDSSYGKSKLLAEKEIEKYKGKISYTIIRAPFILGPNQKELELFFSLTRFGIRLKLGQKKPQSVLISVFDLVDSLILCANNDLAIGKIYFVSDANKTGYTWKEIVNTIAKVSNKKWFWIIVPYPIQYLFASIVEFIAKPFNFQAFINREYIKTVKNVFFLYDTCKIEKEIGFKPNVSLEEGLKTIIVEKKQKKG